MQVSSRQGQPNQNLSNRSRTIAVIAICLFGLAGLLSGFATGAFLHANRLAQNAGSGSAISLTQTAQSKTPTHPQRSHPVVLGIPVIDTNIVTRSEVANGSTVYTFSAQAVDAANNPVQAADIKCKLWLVHRIPENSKLVIPDNILQTVSDIQFPITGTVEEMSYHEITGLTFDSTTPQTHFCDTHGKGNWRYTVSPSIQPGTYDLVVLTDWLGQHYNWSWININIKD
jgi:hypothetical protein